MLKSPLPNLSMDCFLGIEETRGIKEQLYQYIDNSALQEELPKGTGLTIKKLRSVKPVFDNYLDEPAYLLYDGDRDIGAIKVRLNDIYHNIEFVLDFTDFSKDFSDLLIVGSQFYFAYVLRDMSIAIFLSTGLRNSQVLIGYMSFKDFLYNFKKHYLVTKNRSILVRNHQD